MWGKHITLPDDAAADGTLTARIDLTEQSEAHPLPLGKIRVFVFQDNAWTNGAPDTEEGGLQGFKVGLEEQTHSAVTVDYNNNPLCGGALPDRRADGLRAASTTSVRRRTSSTCTRRTGRATATRTASGTRPPRSTAACSCWPPSRRAATAPARRASSCGSRRPTAPRTGSASSARRRPFATPGTGEITGTARNWAGVGAVHGSEPTTSRCENPFVALSDSTTDRTVYIGQGDAAGNFDIQNVPAGSYNLAIWDEQLSYIMRFKPVTVAAGRDRRRQRHR